jgi:hypothetical protein
MNSKRKTRKRYESYLNKFVGMGQSDSRIPEHALYGTWLRRNDPIAFSVGFGEWSRK